MTKFTVHGFKEMPIRAAWHVAGTGMEKPKIEEYRTSAQLARINRTFAENGCWFVAAKNVTEQQAKAVEKLAQYVHGTLSGDFDAPREQRAVNELVIGTCKAFYLNLIKDENLKDYLPTAYKVFVFAPAVAPV